jgi:hypothetical protein
MPLQLRAKKEPAIAAKPASKARKVANGSKVTGDDWEEF